MGGKDFEKAKNGKELVPLGRNDSFNSSSFIKHVFC